MANIRFDRFDNGNPAENDLKANQPNVPFSGFDFSFTHSGNTMIGLFAPIDCFDVVPREKITMSATALLEFRNPTVRQIMNGFRVYFHSRYMRLDNIWEGAHNFVDKGRSGNIELEQPNLIYHSTSPRENISIQKYANACTPMSLLNFLGMPVEALSSGISETGNNAYGKPLYQFRAVQSSQAPSSPSESTVLGSQTGKYYRYISNSTDFFPAAPCFMYQKVWRDHYCNKNLLQNNKFWFPDNEDHFILSYNCENACAILYEDEDFTKAASDYANLVKEDLQIQNLSGSTVGFSASTPEPNNPRTSTSQLTTVVHAPNLAAIKFVQFRGDRFTTSSPFPDLIRGDIPVLNLTEDNFIRLVKTNDPSETSILNGQESSGYSYANDPLYLAVNDDAGSTLAPFTALYDDSSNSYGLAFPLQGLTMSAFYTLETITAFKRKLGMTNGDYNEAIKAQFGASAHAYERGDTYIGGFYQDFAISAVTQQSESSTTPLGTKAGQGVSAGSGSLGYIDVPDYGWIQTYMFIVPDVYYTQGKPRQYSKKTFMDLYFPLFNNLPAQEIRKDELFISGNADTDAQPFSYEDRYAEYKSRTNRVSGFMGLTHSLAAFDSSRIMARRFSALPAFNSQFVTLVPENVDMEVFSVVDEPPFDFQVAIDVRRVSPMPYMATEGSLSSPLLNG